MLHDCPKASARPRDGNPDDGVPPGGPFPGGRPPRQGLPAPPGGFAGAPAPASVWPIFAKEGPPPRQ
eukprot:5412373-Lingulodinium_polyedra.AAC.1